MDYILFGAGEKGREILFDVGRKSVKLFLDNCPEKKGKEIDGIKISSFEDFLSNRLEGRIVICVNNEKNAVLIAKQLETYGINDYLYWDELEQATSDGPGTIDDLRERHARRSSNLFFLLYSEEKREKEYLLDHFRPESMTPATGYLRKRQTQLVNYARTLFDEFHGLEIHPILSAGNLLGLVRHGGFIPWDDDMDFKLIRREYEILKEYCKEHFAYAKYYGRYKGEYLVEYQRFKKNLIEQYPDQYIFLELPQHLQILKGSNLFDAGSIDLFVIDSYDDRYDFARHWGRLQGLKREINECNDNREEFDVIEGFLSEDMHYWDENGDNLFYGGDNCESYAYYLDYDKWLKRDDLLPLEEEVFEGSVFYVPAHRETCVEYVFGKDWRRLPAKMGIPDHSYWNDFYMSEYVGADIWYTDKYSASQFSSLYYNLRESNIYARVLFSGREDKSIVEEIGSYGVETSIKLNQNADYLFADDITLVNRYNRAKEVSLEECFDKDFSLKKTMISNVCMK